MKGECDPSLPALFQSHVYQSLLCGAMMPLRNVGIAVRVLGGRTNLNPVNAPPAFELVVSVTFSVPL